MTRKRKVGLLVSGLVALGFGTAMFHSKSIWLAVGFTAAMIAMMLFTPK